MKKKIGMITALAIFLVSPLSLRAEEKALGISDIVTLVLENSFDIRIARTTVEAAETAYRLVQASRSPSLSFSADSLASPLYGYSIGESFTAQYLGIDQVVETHTIGGSLLFFAPTAAGGFASASATNGTSVFRYDDGDWIVEQSPSLSLTLGQTLFSQPGKAIDPRLGEAVVRSGQIGWEKARNLEADNVGRSVYAALSLLDSVITFRETLTLQEKRLELARKELARAREERGLGRISEADLIAVELGLAQRQNAIIETRYQLLLAERGLERLTGLSDSGETEFRWESREAGWVVDPAGQPEANRNIRMAELEKEAKELAERINAAGDGIDASLSFTLSPRYPAGRDDSGDFGASFVDLFGDDAGFDVTLAVGLSIPILRGKAPSIRREGDRLSALVAALSLEKTKRETFDNAVLLQRNIELLEEKAALLREQIGYDRLLLQREEQRRTLGSATDIDVETVRIEMETKERLLEQAERDLILARLERMILFGMDIQGLLAAR